MNALCRFRDAHLRIGGPVAALYIVGPSCRGPQDRLKPVLPSLVATSTPAVMLRWDDLVRFLKEVRE